METERKNVGWINLLRVLACFLVVFAHSSDAFVGQFDNDRASFLTGVFSGSFVRSCIPLFVMMTGVLLLPVKGDLFNIEGLPYFVRILCGTCITFFICFVIVWLMSKSKLTSCFVK